MASDQPRWWQPVIDASPEDALAFEAAAGQQQRFVQLDTLATRLLTAALHGQPTVSVVRSTGPQAADNVEVLGLRSQEKAWCAETFGVPEQQRRGAWYLPQKLSLKAGSVNLPQLVRERPAHALTLAADDSASVSLVDGAADAVLLWAVLVPLFETLIEPIRVRAAGSGKTTDDQRQMWSGIEERYRLLGIAGDVLDAFRFGGRWHRLDRHGQQHARLRLLDALAAVDPLQLVTRHRILQLQALMAGFAKKSKTGTALARRVVTRALQPVVSGYFAGDWLATLDYLQAPPHPTRRSSPRCPNRACMWECPPRRPTWQPRQASQRTRSTRCSRPSSAARPPSPRRRTRGGSARVVDGLRPGARRPKTRHAAAVGLVDDNIMAFSWQDEHGFTQQLYRQVLPASVNEQVDRLWQSVTLQRHAKSLVSNPRPHQLMAEALGPAPEFWHGVALTAWFVCEGPYSRAPLSGVADYYSRTLTALTAAGCPVPRTCSRNCASLSSTWAPQR